MINAICSQMIDVRSDWSRRWTLCLTARGHGALAARAPLALDATSETAAELTFDARMARSDVENSFKRRRQFTARQNYLLDIGEKLSGPGRILRKYFFHPHRHFGVWVYDFDSVNGPWPQRCISLWISGKRG
jgi:hypothetical protein